MALTVDTPVRRRSVWRAAAMALGVGVVAGVTARVLMRLVALTVFDTPGFTVVGSSLIVALFCLSAVGAALAGHARWRLPWRLLLAAATSFLVVYAGTAIGEQELVWAMDKSLGPTRWAGLIALTVGIGVVTFGSIVTCWRLGGRPSAGPRLSRAFGGDRSTRRASSRTG